MRNLGQSSRQHKQKEVAAIPSPKRQGSLNKKSVQFEDSLYKANHKEDRRNARRSPRGFMVSKSSKLKIGQSRENRGAGGFPRKAEYRKAHGSDRGQDRDLYRRKNMGRSDRLSRREEVQIRMGQIPREMKDPVRGSQP
ncbi:unnamed protein product [Linum trigynum]|uniref:Uncharacterized protein n=1 Tax=Linum trigynum TaxID=586398 RepID=A0AAV2E460_9ROSI